MGKKNIKAILFDLGNVIVDVDEVKLERSYSPHGKVSEGELVSYVKASQDANRYMEGKLSTSQFYYRARRRFRLDMKFGDFYRVWNSIFLAKSDMEDLIRNLKSSYPDVKLILISNTNEAHYRYIRDNYKILDELDGHVVSYEAGCQKPDRRIFAEAMRKAGSIPPETIYVDDRLDLIRAARVMGIHAFHFTSSEQLRADLARFGLSV
ncbi:MAG: HAD-IA family hydrolase [Candidatus Omnitrophica bacterium]|nr:HAD-IA family hydrolase [Candidatus Omnitrophota bacterium]